MYACGLLYNHLPKLFSSFFTEVFLASFSLPGIPQPLKWSSLFTPLTLALFLLFPVMKLFLATLTLVNHDVVVLADDSVPSLNDNRGSTFLAVASFVALKSPFPILQA